MNASVATLPASAVYTPPDWLQSCLIQDVHNDDKADSLICRAFNFAYTLHEGQYRASGEPYIAHPVAVSGLLRDLGGSPAMIAAGFLHDVIEDTDVTAGDIEERFGDEVRHLVEGVTKLSGLQFSSKTERQAENFRRMFLAMAQDIRVIVVKLADRLHNMRTLEHLSEEKQRRIAQETREIFAPLANRLGIGRLKWELEDLCFKYLEPESYREMQGYIAEKRTDREEQIHNAIAHFRRRLQESGIHCVEMSGRPKHLYGIYTKMRRQQKEFHEIYDIAAIRIIVETNEECYRALAMVHDVFCPIPGRFKDYIGLPKPNQYQSLHTVVIGSTGRPLEVQIRTLEMHHIAEYGIAAHWKYKESGGSTTTQMTANDEKFIWLRSLLEWQNDLKDPQEYIRTVKDNLFEDDVYAFTPKGDVIPLARGATPVDFAYRIHTEVGHHCVGAKINDRIVTLDTQLQNGDIVEILTQKNSQPRLDWLSFVVSEGARNRIRQWYKRSHREENILRGREMLEKEVGKSGFDALLKSEPMHAVAERSNYQNVDDLLAGLGYGEITLNLVVNRLREAVRAQQPPTPISDQEVLETVNASSATRKSDSTIATTQQRGGKSPILGVEGLLYDLAKCCNPVPGEPIIGVVSLGSRGIRVHRQGCQNLDQISGDRLIPVSWNTETQTQTPPSYPVNLRVESIDRVGILKDILSRLSDSNINVRNVNLTYAEKVALIDLCIEIRDRAQLDLICSQIRKLSDVLNLRRLSQVED
jgi:GTP diphosphokinase / guanosine-3',5'-bis(diphosphate) 3'-diphosphatase